jgi:hypothetical protein
MIFCPYDSGEFDKSLGILICHPIGELTSNLAHDVAVCRECIVKAGLEAVNRFHDLSGITSIHLRFEDVNALCQSEAAIRQPERPVKACYLAQNPAVYGTIRMYEALMEDRGVEVHVSSRLEELAAVLGIDAAQLRDKLISLGSGFKDSKSV